MSTKSKLISSDKNDEISDRVKLIVSGYIRNIQISLPINDNFYIISEDIKLLVTNYYRIAERFRKRKKYLIISRDMKIDHKNNIVNMKKSEEYNEIYGSIKFYPTDNMIYCWTIKLLKIQRGIAFGIDSINSGCNFHLYLHDHFEQGDKIKIVFNNSKHPTIECFRNDKFIKKPFGEDGFRLNDNDKHYLMVRLDAAPESQSIQLIDFEQKPVSV